MNNASREDRVEAALNSLEGIRRAEANPYLYTRIMARMEEQKSTWVRLSSFISRPAFAVIVVGFLISINVLVVGFETQDQDNASLTSDQEQVFAAEYATVNYSLMDNQIEK